MDVQELGCGGMDWINLAQNRDRLRALLNELMNLRVPYAKQSHYRPRQAQRVPGD
jgi:hypothetical protein